MKRNISILVIATFAILTSFQPAENNLPADEGMVKVTIVYPTAEGSTFNMDYYKDKHMPMVAELLGDALKKYHIDKGIGGRTPADPIPYMAIGYLYFDKLEDYQQAFGPVAGKIVGDIPNYTNVQPVLQISEVVR